MKLITRDSDNAHLQQLKALLEENGIPAHIGGENIARIIPPIAMSQAGLWIFLDHQFSDAVQLTKNPEHQVTTGIDVEAFYQNQLNGQEQSSQLNSALTHLALVAGGVIVLFFFLAFVLERL